MKHEKTAKLIGTIVAAVSYLGFIPLGAVASEPTHGPAECIASEKTDSEATRQKVLQLGPAPSDTQIQSATGLVRVNGAGQRIPAELHESVLRRPAKMTVGDATAMSMTGANVTMFQPRFYSSYCGGIISHYVVADFSFQTRRADGIACISCGLGTPRYIGGYDTFAIAFSSQVYDRGVSFNTCDYETAPEGYFSCGSPSHVFDSNTYGRAYGFRDMGWYRSSSSWGTNADNGRMVYKYYRYPETPTCVQAFTRYGHTWSSTDINGVSVGPWSVGIQWSKNENIWQIGSPGGDACP